MLQWSAFLRQTGFEASRIALAKQLGNAVLVTQFGSS